ncbi:hypothetical protein CRV01_10465 [Arcobacter sp. CECT 8983]|uniref:hypothetical protein n=1 Tax=Arcobacter sp. CECT 8983 TaxID=2044508 RepID=UPI00100ACF6F|nr:hypothetical protein [Arcobacter sp. CECT 8983]RXJ89032.1 hypothetical protein CRV01_10465 [Arcobacter sp. CECT 8983]
MNNPKILFPLALIGILCTYFFVFGEEKTLELIKKEYLYLLAIIPLAAIFIFFKIKLKNYELVDFNKNSNLSFKSIVMFFLIFQVVDYFSEGSFEGMISLWLLYWIMGIIALLLMENVNFYKNYKMIFKKA